MKRFRFAPEALLSLRRHMMRQMEAALADVETRRAGASRDAEDLEKRSFEARRSIDVGGLVRGSDLQRAAVASEAMLLRAADLHRSARALERDATAARRKVLRARRDVETLEKLRERSLAEWRRNAQRQEEALAAELFLARMARRDNQ